MSNLAVNYKQEQKQAELPKSSPSVKKASVTRFEKLLYAAFIAFVVYACVTFIGNKVAIYEVNGEIADLNGEIQLQSKDNIDMKAEIEALSRYERIAQKAKEMGLEINEENVKGLNE